MNKIEAKVPKEGGWQAIDIFLFTNGQRYSPPRKYHLKAEELNRWDSTIRYLARTHCGSLHKVVDLYTLCGVKIDGPLELSDGTPYVAVTPPDVFINSGYERYLIKASRSWEKRQSKRKSIEISEEKPQDTIAPICQKDCKKVPELENDADHVQTIPELSVVSGQRILSNVSEMNTLKMPDDSFAVESMLVKPRKTSKFDQQQPRRSLVTTTPRSEKKHSSFQRAAFIKSPSAREQSNSNSVCKNKATLQRRTLTKIPLKINLLGNELAAKMKSVTNKNPPLEIKTIQSVMSSIPSGLITPPRTRSRVKTLLSTDKCLLGEDLSIPNVIVDKDIFQISTDNNLDQNANSGVKDMMMETYHSPIVNEMTSCYIPGIDEEAQTQIEIITKETNTSNNDLPLSGSKIKVFPVTLHKQDNSINCNFPVDDNCIALINKGNAVNMNLHIDLQNVETNPQKQTSNNTDMHRVSSLKDLLKRKSQNCVGEETILQTNSLQSVVSTVNDTFAKVVVVQCGCCGNNIAIPKVDTTPVYKDHKGFFILMPAPVQTDNLRCPCAKNDDSTCDKKVKSELFVRDLCRPMPNTVYPCVTRQVGMVMTVIDTTGSQTEKYSNNECEIRMVKEITCVNEDKCTVDNCGEDCDYFSPVKCILENNVMLKNNLQDLSTKTAESYTQTEWCRVLFEVRRHEDGRYSFHLPPLPMLRKCSC